MNTSLKKIIAIVLLVFCAGVAVAEEKNLFVRVAVVRSAEDAIVSVRGVYSVINPMTEEILSRGRVLKRSRTKSVEGAIHIGRDRYPFKRVRLSSQKDITVRIGKKDRRYRGDVDIITNKDGTLTVVNTIELERYIRGVLYHEVSSKWPMQATKAQAVAVRTYVMYQMTTRRNSDYDVTSDIYSQVYGGKSAERYRTNIATKETKGEVMIYQGEIVPAYYHSNCAGHTEDAGELWNHDLVPLKGVVCEFDKKAPNHYWRRNFRSKDVQGKLNSKGYDVGLIEKIEVMKRNVSGRVKTVAITDRAGKVINVSGKDFRLIVGPNHIKSNKFDIIMKGYFFDVEGRGWGHGVGMCQWGANGMAKEGRHYEKILRYYYPEIDIVDYRETKIKGF
jgi:stage II sporulation protein D